MDIAFKTELFIFKMECLKILVNRKVIRIQEKKKVYIRNLCGDEEEYNKIYIILKTKFS